MKDYEMNLRKIWSLLKLVNAYHVGKKMKKIKFDNRCYVDRRIFHYALYTPERRSGNDRRICKNGIGVTRAKNKNKIEFYNQIWLKLIRFYEKIDS